MVLYAFLQPQGHKFDLQLSHTHIFDFTNGNTAKPVYAVGGRKQHFILYYPLFHL